MEGGVDVAVVAVCCDGDKEGEGRDKNAGGEEEEGENRGGLNAVSSSSSFDRTTRSCLESTSKQKNFFFYKWEQSGCSPLINATLV